MKRSNLPAIWGYIPRPRVDALIRRGLDYTLVLVMAGPGYGKTLAVVHSLKNADVRLVYVRASTLRPAAADFWEDTLKAATREMPEYVEKLAGLDFPDTVGSFERLCEMIVNVFDPGRRLVLVVDNYERILDEKVTLFLNRLADSGLPGFTLFILCNVMLPFAQVLPATGLFRITDENLAFTPEEARLMFERHGTVPPPDVLRRAMKVTGGWPLGLRLVCESCPENPEDFSSQMPLQTVADLYEQHYFRHYPGEVRDQLVLFSLLPCFSLEMIGPGVETPRDMFAYLLMQHPFISYDHGDGLFTFQAMYHDFLRQRLSLVDGDARRETCTAAGRWFLAHGMTEEAMDCFWDASDFAGFMEAVYSLPKVRMQINQTERILARLESIPRPYAKRDPGVDYARAFMYLNAADTLRARELLLSVEERLVVAPDSEAKQLMLGDAYAALADIATYRGEDTGLAWMKRAFELLPGGTRVHDPQLMALGDNSAFFLPGDEAGQLERMVDYFFEYARYADRVRNGCGAGHEYLFAGEAAYYREEMDRAAKMFCSALLRARCTAQHDIVCHALWNLGRIEVYYGNHKKALACLAELEAYVDENCLVQLYELRDNFIAWFYWRLGDLEGIPAWFADTMPGPETTPIAMAKKHLTGAYYLYLRGEWAKSYALLLQLEPILENRGRWVERLGLYILKAQHHMGASEPGQCDAAFRRAYEMVYANDLKFCLSGFGKEMMALLDYLKRQEAGGYDRDWLDQVYRDAVSVAKRQQMMQIAYRGRGRERDSGIKLTKRENETLHFLAQGLTQKEIGRLMGISENAVKKHVSKIYDKLGAVNRADAIHIATMDGIVDVINSR